MIQPPVADPGSGATRPSVAPARVGGGSTEPHRPAIMVMPLDVEVAADRGALMARFGRFGGIVAAVVVVGLGLAGCGDDDDSAGDDVFAEFTDESPSAGDESDSSGGAADDGTGGDQASVDGTGGDAEDADLVVNVDGTEYVVVDTEMGGFCDVGDTESGTQLGAGGFDEASGQRVELSLRHQIAETTPSGVDEYYGGLSIASGQTSWETSSQEPFPFALADPTSGTVTMTDAQGQNVDVSFELACP